MYELVAFDLDNTLYDHSYYVKAAYKEISSYVSNKHGICQSSYEKYIFEQWQEKGSSYNRIFEESYQCFGISGFNQDINKILELYHSASPQLTPYDGTYDTLGILQKKYKLALITDGKFRTQTYKIKSLRLGNYFERIYISAAFGLEYYKPSTGMFEMCLENEGLKPEKMVYVGDNPLLDYVPCQKLGIEFVRLMKGEYIGQKLDGVCTINDISELPLILERMEKANK